MPDKVIYAPDLRDQEDPRGRSIRQANAARKHNIPVGTLVELESGTRMWVVCHTRDCDQTPLYELCPDKGDTVVKHAGWRNAGWHGGYHEGALKPVAEPNPDADAQPPVSGDSEWRCPHDCYHWHQEECGRDEGERCPARFPEPGKPYRRKEHLQPRDRAACHARKAAASMRPALEELGVEDPGAKKD